MKKGIYVFFVSIFLFTSVPFAYAATGIQIKIDGVAITTDTKPEIQNNRIMVPLRVISEKLGASVEWSNSEVTVVKNDIKVKLKLRSNTAEMNDEIIQLDVKPYINNDRIFVPLRFIAETFDNKVNYSNRTVTIDTNPLVIDGEQVRTLRYETHMTMDVLLKYIEENVYNNAIYNIFIENKGTSVEAPTDYSWGGNRDVLGSYSKVGQYNFLDLEGNILKQFEIFYLLKSVPGANYTGYPEVLLFDTHLNMWYLFNDKAKKEIQKLIEADNRGYTLK